MRSVLKLRSVLLLLVFALLAGACADDAADTDTDTAQVIADEAADDPAADPVAEEAMTGTEAEDAMTESMTDEAMAEEAMTEGAGVASSEICDTDGLVQAVESGPDEGTLAGMADDPVGTAASSNPVLTTLVTAAGEAGLVDTLNNADALTVFAPTDCAFAQLDPATLEAALADPQGLLTTVLGFHVIAGEQIASADLSGDYETFTGETITITGTDVDGQGMIVVPDIQTANATVHLIDTVLLPPSVTEAG